MVELIVLFLNSISSTIFEKTMSLKQIEISVIYDDEEGEEQTVKRESLTFESAEEALGKLQRFIKEQKNG